MRRHYRQLARLGDVQDAFTHHFENNAWGDDESVSGVGSTFRYTEGICAAIPELLYRFEVRSMLNAPCGDYNWFYHMDIREVEDMGADIVTKLVESNAALYGASKVNFRRLDIICDPLPEVDLWVCWDCLSHRSNAQARQVLSNFTNSSIFYLLTTIHPGCLLNLDILVGSFREINLQLSPFNFPSPTTFIEDWIEGLPKRYLALWGRESVSAALAAGGGI